jgi:3-carboxy-cis,cis-muconate cycloisomerase
VSAVTTPTGGDIPGGTGLFGPVLHNGPVAALTDDTAWLRALLAFEAALAEAQADAGLATSAEAAAVRQACRPDAFDVDELGRAARADGNPVIALVRRIVALVEADTGATRPSGAAVVAGSAGGAASLVHRGATSQDALDTAAMLLTVDALDAVEGDLRRALAAAVALAEAGRDQPMAGRTLGRQAAPITFGFKAASWAVGLARAGRGVARVRREVPAVQLGGAVGTLSVLGDRGPAVVSALARRLGLGEPAVAWHTERSRIGELAGALAVVAGAVAKVAGDVVLLGQSEVAEVRDTEPGRGGSSAMPHKRNPVAAVAARASAASVAGPVAVLLGSMAHEHERAAGPWHAEWLPLVEALRSTGSAVAWLADALEHLEPDPAAMAANLARDGGLLQAETVAAGLAPLLGRLPAQDVVRLAADDARARSVSLRTALGARPEIARLVTGGMVGEATLDRWCDPATAVGTASAAVDRALAEVRRW